ncbi:MAG: ImmA/IrrE family metallo-endopeptidase [Firmicutes bacterium]|nr:ImmA/IrrE family metallo-endopeptidase [Bacillota bacterium]
MPGFNRERLTEIRIVRSMTMEQLAKAVGKTKQMVSKYEDGKSIPQIDTIKKMAQVLAAPIKYLLKESVVHNRNTSTLFLRAPLATPQKKRAYARIVSSWGYEIAQALENISQPFLRFSIDEKLTIPDKAMELRRQWNLGTQPIHNMVSLLESRGFNIFTIYSPELKTEAYSQIINGTPIIVLNQQVGTAVRQRFSLAHELGHMVLHRHLIDWEFDIRSKEIENEAQQFAEYFLLPQEGFDYSFVSSKMEDLFFLKKEWLVSLRALVIHCENVGLIDAPRSYFLQKRLNANGWQKIEPFDNEIEYEKPYEMGHRILNRVKEKNDFKEFFAEVRLPIDNIESLCSLPQGSLMKYYDDSWESYDLRESYQPDFEQPTLFDVGGDDYA